MSFFHYLSYNIGNKGVEMGDIKSALEIAMEKVDRTRHKLKTGVKAATYHMLKINKDDGGKVQVLFDI
ncbi:hypothetical protein ES703_79017 [subsurface metagenome]